jgi:hypothetical protein
MTARKFRPTLEALEDRCTPATLSFTAALGGGHSAVSLLIEVQHPPQPFAPETVTILRLLPSGVLQEFPPEPVHPSEPILPSEPITPPEPTIPSVPAHDLFPPTPVRGWLQAADVNSSVFLVPFTPGT